jgi:two-component system response regulator PilR (NtrC family)
MPEARVLVVDDERSMREVLAITLQHAGYDVTVADRGAAAIARLADGAFDIVLTDLRMPDTDGMAVLRAVREHDAETIVIVMTAYASTESAVEAMKLGAYDYVTKPFKLDEIRVKLGNALERKRLKDENRALRRQLTGRAPLDGFIGRSAAMQTVFDTIGKIADSASTVLVTGESGTGKELVARAIHETSHRKGRPFVSINCGAMPETLMESELFGHVKGAFTGAVAASEGLFAAADGGTLFLDEITEIAPPLQVKLLRAIQERQVRRIGDVRDIAFDVRLIAASNRNVERAVAEGVLRGDLFYRLNVIPIHLPPLRDRRDDIPLLVAHFIEKVAAAQRKPVRRITPAALALLEAHSWPGNVRELENVVERAMVLGTGDVLDVDALPAEIGQAVSIDVPAVDLPVDGVDLEATLARIEQRYIEMALQRTRGVQTKAAELLGVSFRQFRYKVRKHSVQALSRFTRSR